ncbi:MAG TPA: NAD-dependent epimerase/dehydratase family protein, partial [Solirubrobacterales bacterium]|nr:NAD-dependent epimerase/dehydratase family protein [Solirubrobacterales bacterium]
HLAAQTLVGPAMADPTQTFEVNVRGTWGLLESCRRADVPAVVVASSDKAYGPSDELPYREEMRLQPASPYEASKAAADAIALSYRPAYGLPVAVTRFANIYGGGDPNFSRLIPEAIAAVLDGRRPQIRSDGSPERDFLYVGDAVAAYLAVESAVGAGGPGAGEAFNAGGETPHSVRDVLETIVAVSGTDLSPEYLGTGNPEGEIDRQFVDSTKLREMTGWAPEVELRDGLIRTLDWYRDHAELRPEATAASS